MSYSTVVNTNIRNYSKAMYVFGTAVRAKAAPSRSLKAFFGLWRGRTLHGAAESQSAGRVVLLKDHDRARTLSLLISLLSDSQQR